MAPTLTTQLHIGASGYAYKEWKGSFYPADLPAKQMLKYYGERFTTVEINASFYRLPTAATLAEWASQVPPGFRFAFKAPQRITHFKRLKDAGDVAVELITVTGTLKARLGPLLFGLPPNMKKDVPRLRDFLAPLPRNARTAVEFRHESWFDDEVFDTLKEAGAALCIAETDDGPEVPFEATADWGYLRLRKTSYTGPQLKAWFKRIQGAGWREAFIYFMHEDTGTAPRFARQLVKLAEK